MACVQFQVNYTGDTQGTEGWCEDKVCLTLSTGTNTFDVVFAIGGVCSFCTFLCTVDDNSELFL